MKQRFTIAVALTVLMSLGAYAKEAKPVSVTTASFQKVVTVDKKGKKIITWVKTTKVVPGDIVKYVDRVTNATDKVLTDVKVSNPINMNLAFIKGSAKCQTKCTVLYSINGGHHFDVPSKLFIDEGKDRHQALPREYNAVQWTIAEIRAESNVSVEFKARLK